ncbi:MAG: signal peptidase I [Clostridiales bacterium GWB2_37_7]|nr:MAG: signal peptidase I [Clostridiales bacterium GWB2_37_7]
MRKILSLLFNVSVSFIILVSLLYIMSAAQTRNNPAHIPSVLGFTPLTVVSGSMSPGIETGDMVVIKKGNKNIKPGDIVTYRLEDVLVTHRVKDIFDTNTAEVFITKGDANGIPDYKTVERSQILGKYMFKIPMGGYIKAGLRGLTGILIIVGLILIGVMIEVFNYTLVRLDKVEKIIKHQVYFNKQSL